jgi:hypothetical protein
LIRGRRVGVVLNADEERAAGAIGEADAVLRQLGGVCRRPRHFAQRLPVEVVALGLLHQRGWLSCIHGTPPPNSWNDGACSLPVGRLSSSVVNSPLAMRWVEGTVGSSIASRHEQPGSRSGSPTPGKVDLQSGFRGSGGSRHAARSRSCASLVVGGLLQSRRL